jgi:hypothetical protein
MQTGEVIPDNIMGIMGDVLQALINKEGNSIFFDFTNDFDWEDGEFGKSGSCWWGQYSDSLPTFEQGGGWCIRFYYKYNKLLFKIRINNIKMKRVYISIKNYEDKVAFKFLQIIANQK